MSDAVAVTWQAPDLTVTSFALCQVRAGFRLIGAAVDAPTVYLVLAGDMHMRVPKRPTIVARRGSMVLLPAGVRPSIAPDDRPSIDIAATHNSLVDKQGLLIFDACGGQPPDLRVLVGRVGTAKASSDPMLALTREPLVDPLKDDRLARQAYGLILDELAKPQLGSAALIATLMKTCVILFARRQGGSEAGDAQATATLDGRIAALARLIQARPSDNYSVQSLAELAAVSRSTLTRQFTELLGATPMEFVLRTRLRHACELLASSAMPIKQIAAASGFGDRSHFSRAFRAEHGVDPRSFREQSGLSQAALPGSSAE